MEVDTHGRLPDPQLSYARTTDCDGFGPKCFRSTVLPQNNGFGHVRLLLIQSCHIRKGGGSGLGSLFLRGVANAVRERAEPLDRLANRRHQ
jgi:hypothetical protein